MVANLKSKSATVNSPNKWSWTSTMLETLINSLKEYKSICEFNSMDINADKIQLYEQVRRAMAGKYATENDFEPVEMTNPEKPVKDMTKEEYEE